MNSKTSRCPSHPPSSVALRRAGQPSRLAEAIQHTRSGWPVGRRSVIGVAAAGDGRAPGRSEPGHSEFHRTIFVALDPLRNESRQGRTRPKAKEVNQITKERV